LLENDTGLEIVIKIGWQLQNQVNKPLKVFIHSV
jgi:hypothetical protein